MIVSFCNTSLLITINDDKKSMKRVCILGKGSYAYESFIPQYANENSILLSSAFDRSRQNSLR